MSGELPSLVQRLSRVLGPEVALYDESFLAKSLEKRRALAAHPSATMYVDALAEDPAEVEEFRRALHITYSEFFRNPLTFAVLEQLVLPRLVERKSGPAQLRVWSAGCAAGQEPYSVAILLADLLAARTTPVAVRIFATDRSEAELAAAQRGVYDEAAVQQVRRKHLRGYFTQQGERFAVADQLKDLVDFSYHDLLDSRSVSPAASVYGDFDLVLCSNLLFYYRPEVRRGILERVYRALAPAGYLVTGEAERGVVEETGAWRAVAPPAAVFQEM